ncbi:hypothetical protein [Streptomyces sp. NPDC021139]|uniref:hypothetical protein n=1 Tax=unclassified Streptomyces TaxID=2593676 RepID=UPI00340DB357
MPTPVGYSADVDDEVEAVRVQVDGTAVVRGADAVRIQLTEAVADHLGRSDHQGVGSVLVAGEHHCPVAA